MLTIALSAKAVMEGALLRLRPKLMTVSTVIAGLLPIFWSARVGPKSSAHLRPPFSEESQFSRPRSDRDAHSVPVVTERELRRNQRVFAQTDSTETIS